MAEKIALNSRFWFLFGSVLNVSGNLLKIDRIGTTRPCDSAFSYLFRLKNTTLICFSRFDIRAEERRGSGSVAPRREISETWNAGGSGAHVWPALSETAQRPSSHFGSVPEWCSSKELVLYQR